MTYKYNITHSFDVASNVCYKTLIPCSSSTVASKIFNFAPALSNLNVSEYLSNPQTCQCKESKFCYEPHGHVITGDLRVIERARSGNLFLKGQNIENQIGSIGKKQKQCFWNPLISMPKIGPKENKWISNISLNGKTT